MTAQATDYAHTSHAEAARRQKGRVLARWCYDRGVGPGVAAQPAAVRRAAARRAGVAPPHVSPDGRSPTWDLVAELLRSRASWDRNHDQQPPPHVTCIACAVLDAPCPSCAATSTPDLAVASPARCPACAYPLDPVLLEEGMTTHPGCHLPADQPGQGPANVEQPGMFELGPPSTRAGL